VRRSGARMFFAPIKLLPEKSRDRKQRGQRFTHPQLLELRCFLITILKGDPADMFGFLDLEP